MTVGRHVFVALSIVLCAGAALARSAQDDQQFAAIRAADLRLAVLGNALALANVALCDARQPGTGMVLHTVDEYDPATRPKVRTYFGFTRGVAVEGVLPGSPAAAAGVRENDAVTTINGAPVDAPSIGPATIATLGALEQRIADLPPDRPIRLDLLRGGKPLTLTVRPRPVCRTRFELRISNQYDASSDGTMVQVSSRLLDELDNANLSAVIAHEFAHNILHHPQRLKAANIDGHALAGLGRNVGYVRQAETQADILSVYLMANAGYDAVQPATFWHDFGARHFGGMFTSRSHPAPRDRAATLVHEAILIAAHRERPIIPEMLATRDMPLDGNWQAILIRG